MGTCSSSTQAYGEAWYWDTRYSNESSSFDWYQKYPSLAPLIHLYIPHRHHPVLVVGCGNSGLSLSLSLSLSHDPYDLLSILIYNVLKDFFFLIVNF